MARFCLSVDLISLGRHDEIVLLQPLDLVHPALHVQTTMNHKNNDISAIL